MINQEISDDIYLFQTFEQQQDKSDGSREPVREQQGDGRAGTRVQLCGQHPVRDDADT